MEIIFLMEKESAENNYIGHTTICKDIYGNIRYNHSNGIINGMEDIICNVN